MLRSGFRGFGVRVRGIMGRKGGGGGGGGGARLFGVGGRGWCRGMRSRCGWRGGFRHG